jgi:hypothetical protein
LKKKEKIELLLQKKKYHRTRKIKKARNISAVKKPITEGEMYQKEINLYWKTYRVKM